MLYLEKCDTLTLLAGAPRKWFEPGNAISVEGARSYFGKLNFSVKTEGSRFAVSVKVSEPCGPFALKVRLPTRITRKPLRYAAGRIFRKGNAL